MGWDLRRSRIAVIVAATLTVVLLPPARADNDPSDKKKAVDAQVRELGEDLHEQNAEIRQATSALDAAEAALPPAQAKLAAARAAVTAAEVAQREAALELAATESHREQAFIEFMGAQAQMRGHREALNAMARAAYMGGDLQRLSVVMNAKTPEELTSAMSYYGTVNRSEKVVLRDLAALQRDLTAKQAALEEASLRIADEQASADAAVGATANARDAARTAQTEVQALIVARGAALDKAEDLKAEIEKRLAAMKAESDRLAQVIKERAERARRLAEKQGKKVQKKVGSIGTGLLTRPVIGPVTSSYGMRYHPILRRYKLHTGTDFGVPSGTSVRAARGGTVIESYFNSAYGNRIVVDHGFVNGVYLVTTYNHLSRRTVGKGDRLDRGEVLGHSGSTGYSTGPHLHFEVMENGRFVNPMTWLD